MRFFLFFLLLIASAWGRDNSSSSWNGILRDARGRPVGGAEIHLNGVAVKGVVATTDDNGKYEFTSVPGGIYRLSVRLTNKRVLERSEPLVFPLSRVTGIIIAEDGVLNLDTSSSGGGERLTATEVSAIPLNKRDFSQLLLLAAGTMTDANGTTNFTQQFAINGQRGVEAVFAMDGADISDPEMGGATFSNFNVDAVQEIQSSSGWMPAEIGHGAAGYTNIVTRSGSNNFHGSLFEFVRNSAFDARNFFDRRSFVNPGRIPPFRRNEFGFTLGGPILSRQDAVLHPVPRLPPGPRHHANTACSDNRRAAGTRHYSFPRRHACGPR